MVRVARGLRSFTANLLSGTMKPISNSLYRAVEATTSASVRWIPLIICIQISCVLSLSVLFVSHHMIGWGMYLWLWKCMQSYDKMFSYSSSPFLLVVSFVCVVFSFCDDHKFIDGSRCENSSWSSGWWRLCCLALGWIPLSNFLLGL